MAWALTLGGAAGESLALDSARVLAIGDILSYDGLFVDSGANFQMFVDVFTGSGNYIGFRPAQSNLLWSRINGITKSSDPTLAGDSVFNYTIERTSTQYIHKFDGVEQFRHDYTGTVTLYGFSDAVFIAEGQFRRCTITNGSVVEDWNPTLSSHAAGAPVLTNTITSNDATGVNFPTDGSAWINLGGGVTSPPWWVFQEDIIIY